MTPPVAVLIAIAGLAPAPSPLDGCEVEQVEQGVSYRCGDDLFAQRVDQAPGTMTPKSAQQSMAAQLATAFEAKAIEPRRMRLAGRDADVVRLRNPIRTFHVTSWSRAEGLRGLTCAARGAGEPCARVLELLASERWRAGPVPGARKLEVAPFRIGDRAVPVPAGCRAVRQIREGALECEGGSSAMWKSTDEERARAFVEGPGSRAEAEKSGVPYRRETLACRLAGTPTRCRVERMEPRGEKPVNAISGWARIGNESILATCFAEGVERLPPPCTAIFTLD